MISLKTCDRNGSGVFEISWNGSGVFEIPWNGSGVFEISWNVSFCAKNVEVAG